jgi:broad specificity phosphatase PhoE
LVRHAPTSATRSSAFPVDEPLDARGRAQAASLRVPARCTVLASPAVRCRETAAAAGLGPVVEDAALAECDFGRWAGRTLAHVHAEDPAAARAWMLDPAAAPHGGESLATFAARVGRWLDAQALEDGIAAAITHAGVVRAALVHLLRAPIEAFWRLDVAPLTITELHAHDGRWTVVRVNCRPEAPA